MTTPYMEQCRWCDSPLPRPTGSRITTEDGHIIAADGELVKCPHIDIQGIVKW
jgi:hypothetical protein